MGKIIGLSGKQYSGKDTVAKIILENFKEFQRIGIGDAIKIEYGKKHDLTFEEIEKNKHLYREDLIALGNWGRSIHPHYWLKQIVNMDKNVIVPDLRVIDEVKLFESKGAYLIRVEASLEARSKRGIITNGDDPTEVGLDNYKEWSYVIQNNGNYEELLENSKDLLANLYGWINM